MKRRLVPSRITRVSHYRRATPVDIATFNMALMAIDQKLQLLAQNDVKLARYAETQINDVKKKVSSGFMDVNSAVTQLNNLLHNIDAQLQSQNQGRQGVSTTPNVPPVTTTLSPNISSSGGSSSSGGGGGNTRSNGGGSTRSNGGGNTRSSGGGGGKSTSGRNGGSNDNGGGNNRTGGGNNNKNNGGRVINLLNIHKEKHRMCIDPARVPPPTPRQVWADTVRKIREPVGWKKRTRTTPKTYCPVPKISAKPAPPKQAPKKSQNIFDHAISMVKGFFGWR